MYGAGLLFYVDGNMLKYRLKCEVEKQRSCRRGGNVR